MKYKKGDKVIIKSREWYNENKDESGIVALSTDRGNYNVTKEDERFFGRVVTIIYEGEGYYIIAEDDRGYVWVDEMIEGPSTSIYNEGDIVGVYDYETDVRIEEVRWDGSSYSYKVYLAGEEEWLCYDDIAYKVEAYNSPVSDNTEFMDMPDNEIKLPYGYVFKDENGNVINTAKITIEKEKGYPKTYDECYKVMGIPTHGGIALVGNWCMEDGYIVQHLEMLRALSKLFICRDAYWKIAGEEMGLGKSWEPDYNNLNNKMYGLYGELKHSTINPSQFVFPSKEMRDEFAKNFKKDIDLCK